MNLDFGMKYLSDNDNSVSILFYTPKAADLLIYDIQFFNNETKAVSKVISNGFHVSIIRGEKEIVFKYPKNNSSSFNSVGFHVKDNTINIKFKVVIKYDESALPDIQVIKKEVQYGNTNK